MAFLRVCCSIAYRGVGETVARVAKCSMIIKHHKQPHTHPTTPYPHPHVFLLSFWVSFIPSSPPDAYHCGRSIKCNVCRREIIGNMWWELKTLSHFKLPIICSKGECIVLQSAWKKGWVGGVAEEDDQEERLKSLSCTWLKCSSDKITSAPCWLLFSS